MAIQIIEDVVKSMRYSIDKDGGQLDRRFAVYGLPGPTGSPATLAQAAGATDSTTGFSIPRYGQAHEQIPGLFCQSVEAVPLADISRISSMVTCHYGWQSYSLGQIQVKITGTRNVLHANRDPATGRLFQVTYRVPAVVVGAIGGFGGIQVAGAKTGSNLCVFDISTFHLVLEISRVETTSPKSNAAAYCGRINLEPGWQGVGGKPYLWMCQSIEGTIMQNGWYNVTYVFEFAPEGWWQIGLYQDPGTHLIPTDIYNAPTPVITKTGPAANGQFGYIPTPVAFSALNIPTV